MSDPAQISVLEFESKVFKLEDIILIVRAPTSAKVGDYTYKRMATGDSTVSDWLGTRVQPLIGEHSCIILMGNSSVAPHGRLCIATLRDSYIQ